MRNALGRFTKGSKHLVTHGMTGTPIYLVWNAMVNRCTNPNVDCYHRYGGRGITVCERWRTFANFYADMGDRPKGHTLERKDNDRGYEPDNVVWLPLEKQAQNRRDTVYIEVNGERVCLAEASRRTGVRAETIRWRQKQGWPLERVLAAP